MSKRDITEHIPDWLREMVVEKLDVDKLAALMKNCEFVLMLHSGKPDEYEDFSVFCSSLDFHLNTQALEQLFYTLQNRGVALYDIFKDADTTRRH